MGKFTTFLKTRNNVKRDTRHFDDYFKSGLYLISASNFKFKKIGILNIFNFKIIKRLYYLKGKGDIECFKIKKGTEKINFISDCCVIAKPYSMTESLAEIKKRVDYYLPRLKFAHSSYKEISVENNVIISNFISGKSFNDEIHNSKLLSSIIRCAKESDLIQIRGLYFYVQHGDATGANIIWSNADSFVLIDNEQVGLYPAFYDFFHLISLEIRTPEDFYEQCKTNGTIFAKICSKERFILSTSFVDTYLSLFIYFRMKSYPLSKRKTDHRPFQFLKQMSSQDLFPKSVKVLSNFYEDVIDTEMESIYKEAWHYHER